jgi:hypothetical protein
MKLVLAIISSLMLFGCSEESSESQGVEHRCSEPRPEICTMEYDPVDGLLDSGEWKSFPNACGACSNPEVIGYKQPDQNSDMQKITPP